MNEQGNGRLNGKVTVVTGSGQGIGEAIASLFAREGADVVVNARTEEHIKRVVDTILQNGGIAHGVTADVGSLQGVNALIHSAVKRFQHIDILVHNAGIFPFSLLEDLEDDAWNEVIALR